MPLLSALIPLDLETWPSLLVPASQPFRLPCGWTGGLTLGFLKEFSSWSHLHLFNPQPAPSQAFTHLGLLPWILRFSDTHEVLGQYGHSTGCLALCWVLKILDVAEAPFYKPCNWMGSPSTRSGWPFWWQVAYLLSVWAQDILNSAWSFWEKSFPACLNKFYLNIQI